MESFTPDVVPGAGDEVLPYPAGTDELSLDSAPATETQGVVQVPEPTEDLPQQQLPRQIHIQQHLKLHFHHQGKSFQNCQTIPLTLQCLRFYVPSCIFRI